MVYYKTRVFCEKDGENVGAVGADVIIYDDAGDVVDTILVTSKSTYNNLVEQLEGIDEKYVDKDELLTLLQNTQGDIIQINATTLNGLSADNYAQVNHNHEGVYAPKSHASTTNEMGLGNSNNYGHVKTINNVSRENYVDGEALAATQGKALSDRINNLSGGVQNWQGVGSNIAGVTLLVNTQLRLASLNINRGDITFKKSAVNMGTIPAAYAPRYAVTTQAFHPYILLYISNDGVLIARSSNYGTNDHKYDVHGGFMWPY